MRVANESTRLAVVCPPGQPSDEARREEALADLLDRLAVHDPPTYEHCRRVASLARQVAARLELDPLSVRAAFAGGLLHDIGHLSTPREVLARHGPLASRDVRSIRRHPEEGRALLRDLVFDPRVLRCTLEHHERPDGRGYPRGVQLEEPITALVAVADTFDTIRTRRWAHRTVPRSQALAEIRRVAGTQLDFDACRALHHLFEEPWIETDNAVASTGG